MHAPGGIGKECVCLLKGNKNSILKWLNERMHSLQVCNFLGLTNFQLLGLTNFQLLLHSFRIALSVLKKYDRSSDQ